MAKCHFINRKLYFLRLGKPLVCAFAGTFHQHRFSHRLGNVPLSEAISRTTNSEPGLKSWSSCLLQISQFLQRFSDCTTGPDRDPCRYISRKYYFTCWAFVLYAQKAGLYY